MNEPNPAASQPQAGSPDAQQPQAGNPNPQAGAGNQNPTNQQPIEVKDLPEWAQKLIGDLRTESANHRKKLDTQEAERQQAEQKRLAEQGEWQKLAETAQAELGQVKPQVETLTGRYRQLSDLVLESYKAEVKDWPAKVKALLPTEEADALEWAESLKKYRPLVEELRGQSQSYAPGSSPNRPNPTGPAGANTIEAEKKRLQRSGNYGF